jgi:hypothetical protein
LITFLRLSNVVSLLTVCVMISSSILVSIYSMLSCLPKDL